MQRTAKSFLIVTVIVLLFAVATLTTACNDKTITTQELVKLADITFPTLRQGQLDIEWLGDAYFASKPTLIYFHGEMPNGADSNVAFELPEDEYPDEIIADVYIRAENNPQQKVKGFEDRDLSNLRDLAYYWDKAGFNVGIFHYEQFADDLVANVYAKLFNNQQLSYKQDGKTVTREQSTLSHNLTEVFVARFLDYMATKPLKGNEIRFVGNGVGASFALSSAEYLHHFYTQGKVKGNFVPRRITLCDPYFSNEATELSIDWKKEDNFSVSAKTVGSALSYSANSIAALNREGMIFEYIESNEHIQQDFNDNETGQYKTILDNTASLEFRQTYSTVFSEKYLWQNRVSLDWYLYTINGSDGGYGFNSDSNIRKDVTYPLLDNYALLKDRNSQVYGISAWTPTTFTRAIVGHKYTQFYDPGPSNQGTADDRIAPYVLEKFQSENNQKSDIKLPYVCGYVFLDSNSNQKIDDGFGAFIANAEVTVEYQDAFFSKTVKTDVTGFYKIELDERAYNSISYITISIKRPSYKYQYTPAVNDAFYNNYLRMDMANVGSQADSVSLSSSYTKSGAKILNCALKPID